MRASYPQLGWTSRSEPLSSKGKPLSFRSGTRLARSDLKRLLAATTRAHMGSFWSMILLIRPRLRILKIGCTRWRAMQMIMLCSWWWGIRRIWRMRGRCLPRRDRSMLIA